MRFLIVFFLLISCTAVALEGTAPFYIERNKVMFSVAINDNGPYLFFLDINLPASVIDAGLARQLGASADAPSVNVDFANCEQRCFLPDWVRTIPG